MKNASKMSVFLVTMLYIYIYILNCKCIKKKKNFMNYPGIKFIVCIFYYEGVLKLTPSRYYCLCVTLTEFKFKKCLCLKCHGVMQWYNYLNTAL